MKYIKTTEAHKITIKDVEFVSYPFTGQKCLDTLEKIMKAVAPVMAAEDFSDVDSVIKSVYSSLGAKKAYDFIKELLEGTSIYENNKKVEINDMVFGEVFAGNLSSLFYLIKFVILEVNYSDFFEEGGIGEKIKAKIKALMADMKKEKERE